MKTVFAASSTFEATESEKDGRKSYEIMFQGFWDKTLAEHLGEVYRLPKICMEIQAKGKNTEKGPKQASNVVRS